MTSATMSASARLLIALVAVFATVASCTANAQKSTPNVVAQFLANADRQYETETQRLEIVHALRDMLNRPAAELRAQHYADYRGNPEAWSLPTLIERYFIPTVPPANWNEDLFYRDVGAPEARDAIRRQLSALEQESAAH